jgi:hypothetical protein
LGSSLPPAELARRDSALFGEVKCLFSTVPEVGKETEANDGHCGDRTLHRTRSRFDRARPVSSQQLSGMRVLGFLTGRWSGLTSTSGQFTCAQKKRARSARPVPHGTRASGQASRGVERSRVLIGRVRSRCELTGLRPDARCSASGQSLERVRSRQR